MKIARLLFVASVAAVFAAGCKPTPSPSLSTVSTLVSPRDGSDRANKLFTAQSPYDPWLLTAKSDDGGGVPLYLSDGHAGYLLNDDGQISQQIKAGNYKAGMLQTSAPSQTLNKDLPGPVVRETLDMRTGAYTIEKQGGNVSFNTVGFQQRNWSKVWSQSDIGIAGDPEAQQVAHANMFYLLSSTFPGSNHSIPPLGLSSTNYGGHIFWDAEVWMLPALIVQHPEYAKPIIDYRFRTLKQAMKNAVGHHYPGAEYAWESADTGAETAPMEFAQERHVTADAAYAAWQYYLWTGDGAYLKHTVWPILQATAQYWAARITKDPDGTCHIRGVMSPDETAGVVDDDAYTNAVVRCNLIAASKAAALAGASADPKWMALANKLAIPVDKTRSFPAENANPLTDRFAAKQADTLLLLHPLDLEYNNKTAGAMLDFYSTHTIKNGPAMTGCINAIVAARVGRGQESLDDFHDSYRPFMRGPWDAFSEKRTTNNIYFLTGMAGSLQSIFYGFAGLQVRTSDLHGRGVKIAGDKTASLYADPHLPPGWGSLIIDGIQFRGHTYNLKIDPGDKTKVTPIL